MSSYYQKLNEAVIGKSDAKIWSDAVCEWEIHDCEEDSRTKPACICGKEDLRYLFTIKNTKNGNILFPIGSSCIKRFEREDLNEVTSIKEKMFQLFHAIETKMFISLNADFFSRKLLKYLFENNVFKPTKYNKFDGENDYYFMLKMFNMKNVPSDKQQKKIDAIIVSSIKPYLEQQLEDKITK